MFTRNDRLRSRQRAYTLIEVLVVVTVLGIAGALVIPSFGSTGVLRIQAAVRQIVSDMTFAQADALAYQSPRAVMFDEDANMYTLVEANDATPDPVLDALYDPRGPDERFEVSLDQERFGGAVIRDPLFDGDATLVFDEIGGPVVAAGSDAFGAGGSVDIIGPISAFRINVSAFTGRVTVEAISP